MQYVLTICSDESFTPPEPIEAATMQAETESWVEEMDRRGIRKWGDRVRPANDATTVRVRNSEVLLSDGPFAETREQIGGYDLIECQDLDEAIAVAAKHPMARLGMIEVRPIWTT